jgi:hypothetical protein
MCRKWIILTKDLMKEYDIKPILCKYCGYYKLPLLLHVDDENEIGDYDCYLCKKGVVFRSICKKCKI